MRLNVTHPGFLSAARRSRQDLEMETFALACAKCERTGRIGSIGHQGVDMLRFVGIVGVDTEGRMVL